MTKERFAWYQKEIQKLKELDNRITNRVRASYSIKNK